MQNVSSVVYVQGCISAQICAFTIAKADLELVSRRLSYSSAFVQLHLLLCFVGGLA